MCNVVCYEDNCKWNDDTECINDEVQINARPEGGEDPYCASFEVIDEEDVEDGG
jgi:hypothetical protein